MRIVIDMQGAQTESRFRGIGRYALSLAQAIVRNCVEHEVVLALNGLLPESIMPIRAAFNGLLPQTNIRVWHALGPTRECDPSNALRRDIAELVREAFITSLSPDVVLVTSLFEGIGDDAVTSVGRFDTETPTAVILHDLIPLISPDIDFRTNPVHIGFYGQKIKSLKRSTALLSNSESSRNEALSALHFRAEQITTISAACDSSFHIPDMTEREKRLLCAKLAINKPFLMYTGGSDERKNLVRLISAFASLPSELRSKYQLLMVGKMSDSQLTDFTKTIKKVGLTATDVVFTGYVSDLELMQLYSLCQLFVFPSIHEGFGLPLLEAMACGAPVIAANATSLPEVVGREDALFDPFSTSAISEKIKQVLIDEAFRQNLIAYGKQRITFFSWDKCAQIAISALLQIAKPSSIVDAMDQVRMVGTGLFKPVVKRILVSKLDHMGDMVLAIPAIMKLRARYPHAQLDALVGSWNVEAARLLGVFDQIYVLDFFSKQSSAAASLTDKTLVSLVKQMSEYDFAIDLRRQSDTRFILLKIPAITYVGYMTGDASIDCHLGVSLQAEPDVPFVSTVLNRTPIALQMLRLIDALPNDVNDYIQLPQLLPQRAEMPGSVALFPKAGNEVKEWGDPNFMALIRLLVLEPKVSVISIFCSKVTDAICYLQLTDSKVRVLQGLPYDELMKSVGNHAVCVANNSFGAHLASVVGVQVIGVYSGQETVAEWSPVFGDARVIYTPVECSPCHIAKPADCRKDFKCRSGITPEYVHSVVLSVLADEKLPICRSVDDVIADLLQAVAPKAAQLADTERLLLSSCIARSIQPTRKRQLFFDISELLHRDAKTGIQRVVRSVLNCLLDEPPTDFDVVVVYANNDQIGYRQLNDFKFRFMSGLPLKDGQETLIDYHCGDVFFSLDLAPAIVIAQRDYLQGLRCHGVRVFFTVHDILFISLDKYFDDATATLMKRWLYVVSESDGVICVSKTTAEKVSAWMETNIDRSHLSFTIDYFHLGADINASLPTKGFPSSAEQILEYLRKKPSFLMVGTLEPRKGHSQTLAAFELLWRQGLDVNLVIIGKAGWLMGRLLEKIKGHGELHKHLFWLEGISDEYLEQLYIASTCLIFASEGEGFGLPLIEAAQYKLPIIARDLPVFHEVAGTHAYYFNGLKPEDIADAVAAWLKLDAEGKSPQSVNMPWQTWSQSTRQLLAVLSAL